MNRTLFLFRPEPGWSRTAALARSMGMSVAGEPIFTIEPIAWEAPPAANFDAILAGSGNAFLHGGGRLHRLIGLPVLAVGRATADAARAVGFAVDAVGKGGLQALLDSLAGRELRLLRLGGDVRVPLSPPPGITLDERAIYRAVPVELNAATAAALRQGGVVALHSGEAGRHLAAECDRLGIDRGTLTILALAPRVAELVGDGWQSIHIAESPTDARLLALAWSLCHSD